MNRKYILIIILILSISHNIFVNGVINILKVYIIKIKLVFLQILDLNVVKTSQKTKLNVQDMEMIVECIAVGLPKMKMIIMGNAI